jgi:hypothetical protein
VTSRFGLLSRVPGFSTLRHEWGRQNPSKVESQESRIHLVLGKAPLARSVLRCFPLLCRQNKRKEDGYRYGREYGYKFGGVHVSVLRTLYTFPRFYW